jgi:hypothetical protein
VSDLCLERFAALKGERFELRAETGGTLMAELIEARGLSAAPFQGRQPFSLLFKGPASPVLPQCIYQVAHQSDVQPLDIFLVPVSADATGACYEAVFT